MHIVFNYILLIVGFVFLVKGADWFVDGSSSVARLLRIPGIIIGLTVVAFGTSAPELAVSVTAALNGSNDIAVGNVVGSNFFNLLMVVGVCAVIQTVRIDKRTLKGEFPISILCGVLLLVLTADKFIFRGGENVLGRFDGAIFLVLFVVFIGIQVRTALIARRPSPVPGQVQAASIDATEGNEPVTLSPLKSIIFIVIGLVLIVLGGNFVVDNATVIARSLGLSEAFIGLTVVAFGTSLPELVTSVVAARKGENDLALGNVVGSNIFNILLILGTSAVIHPISVASSSLIDLIILTAMSIVTFLIAVKNRAIKRWGGIVMILMYIGYVGYLISQI